MREQRRPFSALFALLLAITLFAAACGSSSEETNAADGEATSDGAGSDNEMSDDEMAMADGEHDHGGALEVPEGMAVPQISISAEADTVAGHNLFVDLEDFTITPENASTDPVDGEGHLHLYIDGERVGRFYNTALHLTGLDEGDHEVMVEVSANNHSAYALDGDPIRAITTISVEASEKGGHGHGDSEMFESANPPVLTLTIDEDPKSGWNLNANADDFTFAPENAGDEAVDGEGHMHLYIDGEKITRLYGSWWHISGLKEGEHEVMVEVSNNDHSVYANDGEPVTAMTTLVVTEAQAMLSDGHDESHGDDDDHGDDEEGGEDAGHSHSHGGEGETLDIAAADADVVVSASLADGDVEVENRRVTVEVGQTVGITFDSDIEEQVHLHGYDILSDVGPGNPADFAFLADSRGTFEVELESSGRFLFEIQVS